MGIHRLNHAVLFVRDLSASVSFYEEVLGFHVVNEMPGRAAFLQAQNSTNDHDLGMFQIDPNAGDSQAGQATVGLYHLAWEVDTLEDLSRTADALTSHGALVGATDHGSTKSLYGKDPNGIEFEIVWLVPADRLTEEILDSRMELRPLDLPKEIEKWGATTRSGVGVSRPA